MYFSCPSFFIMEENVPASNKKGTDPCGYKKESGYFTI